VDVNPLLHWLQDTTNATAIRENDILFPWIETVHVAAIVLVVGSISIIDLRLLGLASCDRPVKQVMHDILHDDLEIIAPKVLTTPWKTTRIFFRQRAWKFDIFEGVCLEGSFSEQVDKDGNSVFVPLPHQVGGNLYAPEAKR
jgi:hypothetical protein